jgi:hypothetical protein
MASQLAKVSVSASFSALFSAVLSLANRANQGASLSNGKEQTKSNRADLDKQLSLFLSRYASGDIEAHQIDELCQLHLNVLGGTELLRLDQDLALGFDPPWWHERELHSDFWRATKTSVRNWLREPDFT